ncbi:MAG: cell surface protein SprA [Ignavibacteria bacterium]|nr:cell surface protein SprA [Ignavibacteria bacterium]
MLTAFTGLSMRSVGDDAVSIYSAMEWNRLLSHGALFAATDPVFAPGIDASLPAGDARPDLGMLPEYDIVLDDLPLNDSAAFSRSDPAQQAATEFSIPAFANGATLSTRDDDAERLAADIALAAFSRSLPPIDDSLLLKSDSTARKRFLPERKPGGAIASPFPERRSPFYLQPGSGYGIQRVVKVDSVRNMVLIRELLNGRDIRVPYEMSLDEYIQRRYEYERNRRTQEYAGKRDDKNVDQLTGLLKNLTEFDIPVPPNPLMSIFGDRNRISLRISGDIGIEAGFRIEKSDQQSVFMNQTQFSPNFKQRVNINVNGLIGDKLSIRADWSTERTFEYENQLKIKYTGYDDEIVQSIEAGNVSLQTPSQLISGSGALFGLKAEFQIGPLHLQTVASQKKGEASHMSISGGASETKFERHAYDYSDNHFFVSLDYREPQPPQNRSVYESYYNHRFYGSTMPITIRPDLEINDMEVWWTRPGSSASSTDPGERAAVAFVDMSPFTYKSGDARFSTEIEKYVDPAFKVESQSGIIEVGNFKKLIWNVDYTYNSITGILTLLQSVQEDQVVAVAYRVKGDPATGGNVFYGTFVTDSRLEQISPTPRLVLKLVKPRNLSPTFTQAWKHRVRSIYSLNMRNMKKEDIANFRIVYRAGATQDNEAMPAGYKWLNLFGLDHTDDNGGSQSDGRIDFVEGVTVNSIRGEIIFPTLEPWNDGLRQWYSKILNTNPLDIEPYLYPEVYKETKTQARMSSQDKILIVGTTKGSTSSSYYLGPFVVAGSVKVRLDGQLLNAGTDYTVDEQVGQVRILREEALTGNKKLDIEFEKQDLFSFASKTMMGLRGDVALGKESFFGFTLMSLNQQTLSDKVRIGEEPISNTMFGMDLRTRQDLPFITDALNTLPFIQTKEKSSLTLAAEVAMMMPDPNTKLSTIPSDEGKGIAYIDDFEGARVFIPLQTAYSAWHIGSVPKFLPTFDAATDREMHAHRAKMNWFNVPLASTTARYVTVTDIWPNKLAAREDQRVTVLDLTMDPTQRGMYNMEPVLTPPTASWNGIMRTLPVNATNLVDGNYNYIEIWMKVETQNPQAKLLIDLGKISEEVIPNDTLNSEDLVVPGSIRNQILNPGEDVGLDMLTDDEERARYASQILTYGLPNDDPSGDNYAYNPDVFTSFNGTQGNIDDGAGQFPDTEDINSPPNGILDLSNDYFQYQIDLDTSKFSISLPPAQRNPYVVGGGTNGWYQFRIPLTSFKKQIGVPTLDNVEYLRVSVTGAENLAQIRVAEFNFVGNQWYERSKGDSASSFSVSVVNVEDNPEYVSPPGVVRERDRRRPDQEVYMNEQSLSLAFSNLPDTTLREAYRLFPSQGVDMFNYESLKMYLHGDDFLDSGDYESVVRFGIDTLNYYEYRAPIYPGWDSRNEVAIKFTDLTATKTLRDSCDKIAEAPVPGGPPNSWFRVVGCPDIVAVRFISAGVRNKHRDMHPISGQIWINELRVIGPNKQKGYAYTGSANIRLADIADVNLSTSYSDPYFHGLSDRFSTTRAYTSAYSVNTTLNMDKVFPKEWQGTQVRVTYTHAENLSRPLLLPGQPDVEVEGALRTLELDMRRNNRPQREIDLAVRDARLATQTLEIRDSWAIPTIRLKVPGKSWLIEDFVNRLELGYNYSITRFRDPTIQRRRNWQWSARVGYGFDFGRELYVQPFRDLFDGLFLLEFYKDAKFYFAPQRVGMSADLNRSRVEEQRRNPPEFRPFIRDFTHNRTANISFTLSEQSFLNLSGSLSEALQTSLLSFETEPETDGLGNPITDVYGALVLRQRQSSAIFSDIFFGRGSLNFGLPIRYTQSFSLNSRPQLPKYFDIDRYFDMSGGYTVNYNWQENLQQLGLGRTASYNSTINWQVNFRVKSLFDPLFDVKESAPGQPPALQRGTIPGRGRREIAIDDTKQGLIKKQEELEKMSADLQQKNPEQYKKVMADLKKSQVELARLIGSGAPADSLGGRDSTALALDSLSAPGPTVGQILGKAAYYLIKIPLLDYENVSFTFSENNNSTVAGVRGGTGFSAFWTTSPGGSSDPELGPSRLYQFGLISDPNPKSGSIALKNGFPFVGINGYERGLRAPNPNGTYVDNFSQSNTVSIKTSRPLWEGARVDLNWDLRWSMNKNTQFRTDSLGQQTITGMTSTGSLERSYMAFPDFLFFGLFNTNVDAVAERYRKLRSEDTTANPSELLTQAFEDGFEAVPWLTRTFGGFLPRMNWGLRWDGLEKLAFLQGFADRISFEHRYASTLTTAYHSDPESGERITESKRVGFNFAPLIGLTFSFNKLWGGDMTVNSRWGKQKNFDLNTSSSNIVEQATDEITLTANFRKSGFDMPLFGLSLKNDIDFSFSFSMTKSSSFVYEINNLEAGGLPREGTTRITIEPRVRYTISQRVQSSLFYRYQRTKPDDSVGSRIPGTTIHEGGLELRIQITGS